LFGMDMGERAKEKEKMKRLVVPVVAAIAAAGILAAGCAQAQPAPTPTKAPAASVPATAEAKTPVPQQTAAQPTNAPASKSSFPEKDKTITMIIPWPAGGGTDVPARLLAPLLEKELGVPIQIVNKPGASGQIGITELSKSKPDGYTFGYTTLPGTVTAYLDPDRKAGFSRKDLLPLAQHNGEPGALAVNANTPYQTVKDVVDAAKANPGKIRAAIDGIQNEDHLVTLQFQKLTGTEFTLVPFQGGAEATTALAGGHVDLRFGKVSNFKSAVQSGKVRVIGIQDKEESKHYPGVKTFEAQGYNFYFFTSRGISLPAGTPKDVVDVLSAAIKKCAESEEHVNKLDELGIMVRYLNPEQYAAFWDEIEAMVEPLIPETKKIQ
jgi:tripartite-type tricarboxylate transporter receptor subunit TctC